MVFPHGRMKPPWIDPGSGELMALSLLASLGCVLALARRDLVFAIVFALAIVAGLIIHLCPQVLQEMHDLFEINIRAERVSE
jgi:hypothetical protein